MVVKFHKFLLFAIMVITGSGCISFNNSELVFLNVYKEGEVLVFKSLKSGNEKFFRINKITNTNSGYSEAHFGPQRYGAIAYNESTLAGNDYPIILSIFKDKNGTSFVFTFELMYAEYKILPPLNSTDSLVINGRVYKQFFVIKRDDTIGSERYKPNDVVTVFWQKDLGIIKYTLRNGEEYVRINIDK